MRAEAGRYRCLLLVGMVATAAAFAPLQAEAAPVQVTVSGVAINGGEVFASLCAGGLDRATCTVGQRQPAAGSQVTFLFSDVTPGRYAALAFQDVDGTGELRRSTMGRPLEPYGLSNGAGRSHRPTFERAAVTVGPNGARITIRLERPGSL